VGVHPGWGAPGVGKKNSLTSWALVFFFVHSRNIITVQSQ
jgi:hypothetical protein